jgi:hypothetical protein
MIFYYIDTIVMKNMEFVEQKTIYFNEPGRENTEKTLHLAKERAEGLGLKNIVVASSSGDTGVRASEIFTGYNLVVVTSVAGYQRPNEKRIRLRNRELIIEKGAKIITAAHAFGAIGRSINKRFGAIQIDEIIAHVLRLVSEGVKVGCEIASMAVDAGFFSKSMEAIAIGGSGGGADTALVLKPSNTHSFFDTRILEIICKPR